MEKVTLHKVIKALLGEMSPTTRQVLFVFAFMLFLQASCMQSRKVVSTPSIPSEVEQKKLLFVNLLFLKTADGKDSCDVINSIVVEGTLKETEHPVRNKENYYTLFFNSCSGNTLYKEEIDNQLDTQMEVHNESGVVELKSVSFKQREYGIRMQKGKEKICRLVVTKTVKGQTQTICNHLIAL